MGSKHFLDIVEKMKEIHDRKNHDYASEQDPFSNFTRAATIVSWFKNPVDQVFAGILGIKLARLAELSNGKEAKNESINDTFIDSANYFALWGAYYLSLQDNKIQGIDFGSKPPFSVEDIKSKKQYTFYPIHGDKFPEICTICNRGSKIEKVNHAVVMHGAKFSDIDSILTYPDSRTAKIF